MENNPNFLFMIGNKRSGTSLLVRLLNLHPEVFISHESDAIWIVYQLANGLPIRRYPWDGSAGLQATLDACGDILEQKGQDLTSPKKIQKLFTLIHERIMKSGSRVQQSYVKNSLSWIGDKKPSQQADPKVFSFIVDNFPDAHFLHLIRDPKAVVGSMASAARNWNKSASPVGFWEDSAEKVLERWAIHEEWVLAAKSRGESAIFSLRFEDLCENPKGKLDEIFAFMNLQLPVEIAEQAGKEVMPSVNAKHVAFVLPDSERADAIMKIYGYQRD